MIVQRTLPADYAAEMVKDFLRPVKLVKIEYENQIVTVSNGPEIVFGGHTFISGGVSVSPMRFDGEGNQDFTLVLNNENNSASALVLSEVAEDKPVTVWETYIKEDGSYAEPVLYASGSTDKSSIRPDEVTIQVRTTVSRYQFVPNLFFTKANGFNHLLKPGQVLVIGSERYVV